MFVAFGPKNKNISFIFIQINLFLFKFLLELGGFNV